MRPGQSAARDHPRGAGLAVHLGAVLDLPTAGVTDRPLTGVGSWPADRDSATSSLLLAGELVGYWLRSAPGRRPVVVHAGWRVNADTALEVVRRCAGAYRTPAPIREARRLARRARSESDT